MPRLGCLAAPCRHQRAAPLFADRAVPTGRLCGNSCARAITGARKQIFDTLKEDRRKVRQAFEQFDKLDLKKDLDKAEGIVQRVCMELQVHTRLEEALLYPAARESIGEPQMMDAAEIEHQSAKTLIQQLQQMSPQQDVDRWAATFTVLCEYVQHHAKEEEHGMFPKLAHAQADWMTMSEEFQQRRGSLMSEMGMEAEAVSAPKRPTHSGSGSRH